MVKTNLIQVAQRYYEINSGQASCENFEHTTLNHHDQIPLPSRPNPTITNKLTTVRSYHQTTATSNRTNFTVTTKLPSNPSKPPAINLDAPNPQPPIGTGANISQLFYCHEK
jgi:hypothetical protein